MTRVRLTVAAPLLSAVVATVHRSDGVTPALAYEATTGGDPIEWPVAVPAGGSVDLWVPPDTEWSVSAKANGVEIAGGLDRQWLGHVGPSGATIAPHLPAGVSTVAGVTTTDATSYTLGVGDSGTAVILTSASLATVTVPTGGNLPVGFHCLVVAAGGEGATLNLAGITRADGGANDTAAQGEAIYLQKTGTDAWLVIGASS